MLSSPERNKLTDAHRAPQRLFCSQRLETASNAHFDDECRDQCWDKDFDVTFLLVEFLS